MKAIYFADLDACKNRVRKARGMQLQPAVSPDVCTKQFVVLSVADEIEADAVVLSVEVVVEKVSKAISGIGRSY